MTNETRYEDGRSKAIERNLGTAVAAYADRNLAGWVLDLLADSRMNPRGPLAGRRVCDTAAEAFPEVAARIIRF